MDPDSADILDTLRAHLAQSFAVERELGKGGMGQVFLGRDIALDRPVAIKVIAARFALLLDDGRRRQPEEHRGLAQQAGGDVAEQAHDVVANLERLPDRRQHCSSDHGKEPPADDVVSRILARRR